MQAFFRQFSRKQSCNMASSSSHSSSDPLRRVISAISETKPPPRSLIGYSYVPRFIEPPPVELTKSMVSGVDCDEVYPNIFIGDEGSARNKEFLNVFGITHVFNTAEGSGFGQVSTGATFYAGTGIKYLGLNITDTPRTQISNYFEEGVDFIDSAINSNGKVLVHCLMGLSRSTTFVVAYLLVKKGMTVEEAFRTICRQREVRPNDGFLIQLLQLEKNLRSGKQLRFLLRCCNWCAFSRYKATIKQEDESQTSGAQCILE